MYISDFITLDNERYYVAVDTRTAQICLERVSNDAFATFMERVLFPIDPESIRKQKGAAE
ncbi:hypothetical protein [Sinorhizobium meliloti]|uniref:hypothetical protein n=1 Tax=Rhizobium meliloti TaxID=382 RepID=UPI000FE0AE10|nr:hypothetical protein [Sinorhizobium meliloti]RVL94719.1 hypothetical protein CN136_21630 [Sinorhizobium meliloti]